MPYSFRSEQWLPYPVDTVFAFFADPENLPALILPGQRARIDRLTLVPPPNRATAASNIAGAGTRLTLSFRPLLRLPLRVSWEAEITEFAWNDHFSDRQVHGPFAYWRHNHRTRMLDRNGLGVTILIDEIEYELPLGLLGRLAHSLFVRRQIESAFAFRREQIVRTLAQIPQPVRPQSRAG
jgi:ligand-binding SRPBCC domain-containing protein